MNAGLYLSHAEGTDRGLSVVGALLKTSLVREQWAETPFQEVLLSTSCHPLAHRWQTSIAPINCAQMAAVCKERPVTPLVPGSTGIKGVPEMFRLVPKKLAGDLAVKAHSMLQEHCC